MYNILCVLIARGEELFPVGNPLRAAVCLSSWVLLSLPIDFFCTHNQIIFFMHNILCVLIGRGEEWFPMVTPLRAAVCLSPWVLFSHCCIPSFRINKLKLSKHRPFIQVILN